jgi:hypothetical protein
MWEVMEDDPTPVGDFCRTCWKDVNNGCANSIFDVTKWKAHFEERHPDTAEKLVTSLTMVYSHYILSLSKK